MTVSFPLEAFFRTGLETSATLEAAGVSAGISGHFINEFEMVSLGADAEMSNPVFYAKEEDVQNAKTGDKLTVNGTTYYIASIQPDGYGAVLLELSKDEF